MSERKETPDEKMDDNFADFTTRYSKKLPDMVHKQQILHMIHSSLWGSHEFREGHMPRRIPLWCTNMERVDKAVTGV